MKRTESELQILLVLETSGWRTEAGQRVPKDPIPPAQRKKIKQLLGGYPLTVPPRRTFRLILRVRAVCACIPADPDRCDVPALADGRGGGAAR